MEIFKVNGIEGWAEAPQIIRLQGRKSLRKKGPV
jgi:hypothetical protein